MQHLTKQQLLELKQVLVEEKQSLESRINDQDSFGLSDSLAENTGELSAYDNHPADLATELYERQKDIALNESAEEQHREIEAALEAMDRGTYGLCQTCQKPIEFERLQAIPTTLHCKEHTPSRSTSDRRPVEEQIDSDFFGNIGLDERPELPGFDSEDTWQTVAGWGTSNTPAMAEDREIDSYDEVYIESDEFVGFVEPMESFLATDLYGNQLTVIRNKQYRDYMDRGEGEPLLEPDQWEE